MSSYDTKLTPAEVASWADKFEAANIASVWGDEAKALHNNTLHFGDLNHIGGEIHNRKVRRAVEAFDTTMTAKAYMLSQIGKWSSAREPERKDMRDFARRAKSTRDQYGKARPAWQPKGGCTLKLKLSEAVSFGYSQEAYADMSTYLVPVVGDATTADLEACKANLSSFFRYADTHTGWAGSGANWTASLHTDEHGAIAVVSCRSSIAD